ncbi:MAG: hypothetical protein QXJ19_05035 [Candidatus Bathyarchaeia archaeon]|nr:hypothetical protein [Candidatus Bathyarchaeota archaeon]
MDEGDIKDLLRRLDDISRVLKVISDDLSEIIKILRNYIEPKVNERQLAPKPNVGRPKKIRVIDDVQRAFPKDLLGLLLFDVTDEYIIVKPKQYLGSENFARIASIVREQFGGEYVSQGKESHFRIPR